MGKALDTNTLEVAGLELALRSFTKEEWLVPALIRATHLSLNKSGTLCVRLRDDGTWDIRQRGGRRMLLADKVILPIPIIDRCDGSEPIDQPDSSED